MTATHRPVEPLAERVPELDRRRFEESGRLDRTGDGVGGARRTPGRDFVVVALRHRVMVSPTREGTLRPATNVPRSSQVQTIQLGRGQVAEEEAVALDELTGLAGDRRGEDRAGMDEGVELTVLTAGIDAWR